MGYTKIVQYGNVTEIYEYEKELKRKRGIDAAKAHRLQTGGRYPKRNVSLKAKRTKDIRERAKKTKTYTRRASSVLRSQQSFFRLVHHNNIFSDSIHFVTLTFSYDLTYKTACRHVARYMERIKKNFSEVPIRYISVPELTKKGRFHFHLLVYDLPPETASIERKTRNLQRSFERGYVDVMLATYTSRGIAGYMAKYMAKAINDPKVETTRGYNNSRNIKKIRSAGSNSFRQYADLIIPTEDLADVENRSYDVPYLGQCNYTKIIKEKYAN